MKPDDGPSSYRTGRALSLARMLLGEHAMNLASVFDWFAQDSIRAAEQTNEPRKREILLKLASQWAAAAQRCRDEQLTLPPGTPQSSQHRI
jgi:hypothetical protein